MAPRQRQPLQLRDLANLAGALTGLRLLLALVFPFIATVQPLAAIVYAVGMLTDVVDGPVARWQGTTSYTGSMADAVLDKTFNAVVALSLVATDALPALWLLPLFARDWIQLAMVPWLVGPTVRGEGPSRPMVLGKLTTILLAVALVAVMLQAERVAVLFTVLTGVTGTTVSLGYLLRELALRREG